MIKRTGAYTIVFESQPVIAGWGSVVGKKEAEGPLKNYFDKIIYDSYDGCDTFEQAESMFQGEALEKALERSKTHANEVDCVFLALGGCLVESGAADRLLAAASSHFCSAERQYRFPLEYGGVRTPTAQWTVTGAGSCILKSLKKGICVARATVGRIVDLGVSDANNMGAAMAPAAAQTLECYLEDTKTSPENYDMIITGDLGEVGSKSLYDLLERDGINIRKQHNDCGLMIFERSNQDVHAGGSGCGCAASVLCSKIMDDFQNGLVQNILFMATGTLMSPTSSGQGANIPSIAHLVNLKIK